MKCALFTCGVNIDHLDVTVPFMKDYCKKYNLDFILNEEQKMPNFNNNVPGAFERFAMYDLLDTYDRILYVDTDIIIKKNSPNIFDLVPQEQLGTYFESDNFDRGGFLDGLKTKYGYKGVTRYFNNGVLVVSKQHKHIFDIKKVVDFFKNHQNNLIADMDYQNIYTHQNNIPICSLSYKFNYLIRPWNCNKFELAHFVHFAGCWNKKVLIKKFLLQHPCED